jgi:formylglycine-generating enzyme required for sulfatase activity
MRWMWIALAFLLPGCSTGGKTGGMVAVGASSFMMGCNQDVDTECLNYEEPYHEVTLSGFEIDTFETTQQEYAECLEAGDCAAPTCDWEPGARARHPVVCITYDQARSYCQWVGKRLCSEAEWERAARGTDGRKFPWGNQAPNCDLAVMDDGGAGCGTLGAFAAGSKPGGQSPCGAQDMAGNVLEWTADWFGVDYYQQSPRENPPGPDSGTSRVMRGGSFNSTSLTMRTSYRAQANPVSGYNNLGVRCCK